MTALPTGVRNPKDLALSPLRQDGDTITVGQTFSEGWMLMRDGAAGTLQVATEAAGLLCGGFATKDQYAASVAGDTVNTFVGIYSVPMSTLAGDSFTDTSKPAPIFAINNNDFGALAVNPSTGATRSIAGCFLRIDPHNSSNALAWIGPEGVAMAAALQSAQATGVRDFARTLFTSLGGTTTYAAGILSGPANTTLPTQDGIAVGVGGIGVGDVLWAQKGLANLPAAAQAGPWQILSVGSGSSKWTACRPWWYRTGDTIPTDYVVCIGPEGTGVTPQYASTRWMAFCAPGKIIDTDDPLFFPGFQSGSYTASSGVVLNADHTFAIRSATLSSIKATNQGTASHASTVGPPRVTAVTGGDIGASSLTIKAESAPGTTNASDAGVYTVAVTNWT